MKQFVSNHKAALSHAHAYVYEELEDCGYTWDGKDGLIKQTQNSQTIAELVQILDRKFQHRSHTYVKDFYKAMLKVVPHLKYKEHSGTECRGWYRVWSAIVLDSNYFSSLDLGRDADMALSFVEHGAITQEQYQQHITKRTLKHLSHCVGANGVIDVAKVRDYFLPEWQSKCLDMALLDSVAQKQHLVIDQ